MSQSLTSMTTPMTYRELLSSINQDLSVRDDSRLDGPVVLAVLDDRGVVHFGRLVAFSVGAIPGRAPDDVEDDVFTSATRVAPAPSTSRPGAPARPNDVDAADADDDAVVVDPDDFSVGDRTSILDIRSMDADLARVDAPDDESTTPARRSEAEASPDSFDEETTVTHRRPLARPRPRDTLVHASVDLRPPGKLTAPRIRSRS